TFLVTGSTAIFCALALLRCKQALASVRARSFCLALLLVKKPISRRAPPSPVRKRSKLVLAGQVLRQRRLVVPSTASPTTPRRAVPGGSLFMALLPSCWPRSHLSRLH